MPGIGDKTENKAEEHIALIKFTYCGRNRQKVVRQCMSQLILDIDKCYEEKKEKMV